MTDEVATRLTPVVVVALAEVTAALEVTRGRGELEADLEDWKNLRETPEVTEYLMWPLEVTEYLSTSAN